MTTTPSIYVVDDDDPSVRSSLLLLLTSVGFNVRTFESALEFLDWKTKHSPDFLFFTTCCPEQGTKLHSA